MSRFFTLALVVVCFYSTNLHAQLTINLNIDSTWDDLGISSTYTDALESAANEYASWFTTAAKTIEIDVGAFINGSSSTLAATSLSVPNSQGYAATEAQGMIVYDFSGFGSQGAINFNFNYDFFLGNTATSGSFDLTSIFYHELTHLLGFASLLGADGEGFNGNNGYFVFDSFLVNSSGTSVLGPGPDMNVAVSDLTGNGSNSTIFFNGANAVAANGGNPVALNTPTVFSSGSSISHLDPNTFATGLMRPALGSGVLGSRSFTDIEIAIMADLGYAVSAAIPEPATVTLAMGGIAVIFVWIRKKRRS